MFQVRFVWLFPFHEIVFVHVIKPLEPDIYLNRAGRLTTEIAFRLALLKLKITSAAKNSSGDGFTVSI